MLEIKNKRVTGENIHKVIESKNKNYSLWVKRVIRYADLEIDKDFFTKLLKSTGGAPKTKYEFTIEAAKEICLLERNEKGRQIRRWLISIGTQKENFDLLNHDQIVYLSVLENFFKYTENQKAIETKHKSKFVNESNSKYPFADFHKYRNNALQIEPERLNEQIKEYCIEQNKSLPRIKSKRSQIQFLDRYDNLKNAIWTF